MPTYTYTCKQCTKSFSFELSMDDPKPDICECDGQLKRDYSDINTFMNVARNDPKSSKFWKRGKTVSRIADIIEGKEEPY